MKRKAVIFVFVLALVLAFPMGASAQGIGNTPKQLVDSGWFCFDVPGLGVHCVAPGTEFSRPAVPVKYFDTTDTYAAEAVYLGTELLIRADLYRGQPCPQEGIATYHNLGNGYYACHHR